MMAIDSNRISFHAIADVMLWELFIFSLLSLYLLIRLFFVWLLAFFFDSPQSGIVISITVTQNDMYNSPSIERGLSEWASWVAHEFGWRLSCRICLFFHFIDKTFSIFLRFFFFASHSVLLLFVLLFPFHRIHFFCLFVCSVLVFNLIVWLFLLLLNWILLTLQVTESRSKWLMFRMWICVCEQARLLKTDIFSVFACIQTKVVHLPRKGARFEQAKWAHFSMYNNTHKCEWHQFPVAFSLLKPIKLLFLRLLCTFVCSTSPCLSLSPKITDTKKWNNFICYFDPSVCIISLEAFALFRMQIESIFFRTSLSLCIIISVWVRLLMGLI